MSKYSKEFKLKAVETYLSQHMSQQEVATSFNIYRQRLSEWLFAYQARGKTALALRHTQRVYSPEFKRSVLAYKRQSLMSLSELAIHFAIPSASSIFTWEQRYNQGGIDALMNHRGIHKMKKPKSPKNPKDPQISNKPWSELSPAELLREVEYLQAENAYLKKLEALIQEKKVAQKIKSAPSED